MLVLNWWLLFGVVLLATSGQRISTKSRIACRAVIDDWMNHFASYTAAETPSGFSGPGNLKNAPFHGDLNFYKNSLGPS